MGVRPETLNRLHLLGPSLVRSAYIPASQNKRPRDRELEILTCGVFHKYQVCKLWKFSLAC